MNIIETGISFVSGTLVPIGIYYHNLWSKKKKQGQKDIVIEHLEIQLKNQEVLDEIRVELNASRVNLWKFSNGSDFIDNTHMLNISMVGESNDNDFPNIKEDFFRLPATLFDRKLNALKINDYVVSSEVDYTDNLSSLNKSYGMISILAIKILDTKQKWGGILLISFPKVTMIASEQIAWALNKSKQLH